jgi:RNA polymerase sigma-70 factor (ECF subfamily)
MWPQSIETDALLISARKGDRNAVNSLLEKHRAGLRKMVELRLDRAISKRVDASDVVQDVLIEANERLQGYLGDPKLPFSLWLRHLAKDRLIDLHRRHRGSQKRSVDRELPMSVPGFSDRSSLDLAAQILDPELTPAARTVQHEMEERFLAALEELDEDDKEIILMRHFEQLGNAEAADMLWLSTAAAGMRHLRALRKLRTILGLEGDEHVNAPVPS